MRAFDKLPNGRAIVYLLLATACFIALQAVNACWDFPLYNNAKSIIHRVADALLLALPVWGLRRKRFLFAYLALLAVYLLSNVWYYRNYGCIMPLTSYLLVDNLPVIGRSVLLSLRWIDLPIVLPLLCFAGIYALVDRWKGWRMSEMSAITRACYALGFLAIVAVLTLPHYLRYRSDDPDHPDYRFRQEQIRALREYGWIDYLIFQFGAMQGCTSDEKRQAEAFVREARSRYPRNPLVDAHSRNLILILVESLCDWPIGLKVADREVTPRLNAMARDTGVLYFPRVLPQVKDGRSSDAQLMLNTGLLPLASGAASGLYGSKNTFPSLPKALRKRGYTSVSLTCDYKTLWNQEVTSIAYGFDRLYDQMGKGCKPVESDRHLYANSLPVLRELRQPFYAQVVTYSGHDAVETDFESYLQSVPFADPEVRNYLVITQYVDRCIGEFLDSLQREDLFEQSIVVITGDHSSTVTRNRFDGRKECTPEDRFIPLLILNAPLRTATDRVVAQSDIYPSLLDMMGVHDYPFRGVGESLFRQRSDCAVDAANGWAGTERDESVRQRRKEAWRISDILLRMDFFRDDPAFAQRPAAR